MELQISEAKTKLVSLQVWKVPKEFSSLAPAGTASSKGL